MRPVAVLLVCLVSSVCSAQTTPIVITNLPIETGDYYLLVRRSPDGIVTVWRIPPEQIATLDDAPTPGPDPDPDDPHTELRTIVRQATAAVTDPNKERTQKAVGRVYSSLSQLPFATREALVKSTNLMLDALGLVNSWDQWRTTVHGALAVFVPLEEAKLAWSVVGATVDE